MAYHTNEDFGTKNSSKYEIVVFDFDVIVVVENFHTSSPKYTIKLSNGKYVTHIPKYMK